MPLFECFSYFMCHAVPMHCNGTYHEILPPAVIICFKEKDQRILIAKSALIHLLCNVEMCSEG